MLVDFNLVERSALYGMLADNVGDIIVKSDERGFILSASPAIAELGVDLAGRLIGPNLCEMVAPPHVEALQAEYAATLAGYGDGQWHDFPVRSSCRSPGQRHDWFEIRMRRLCEADGQAYGVLSVLRNVTERKALEDRLFAAELTDPLTRLTNRMAFTAMLDYLVANGAAGCLALFDLDHFMALNMHYGQSAGDDLLCAFADMLRDCSRSDDIISRIGAERFAVLLPQIDVAGAQRLCQPVIETLAALGYGAAPDDLPVTASAGIAKIEGSLDATLRRAEIALFMAKAKGRSRVETCLNEPAPPLLPRRPHCAKILAFPARVA